MERLKVSKDSKKYGFKQNEEYDVLRNIMGECVIIIPEMPNVIMSERKLRLYGIMFGTPELGGA